MGTTNGNSNATAPKIIKGRGIANRHADKCQLAAMAASFLEHDDDFEPSARQLSQVFGVSLAYIAVARELSPETRKAIASGKDSTSFAVLLNPPESSLALPAQKPVSDARLAQVIRSAGIERTLNTMVEAAE
jgi:hypothetical protein